MDIVMVKLVVLGKEVKEYEVSDDATVGGLLKKAGVRYKPGCITVDHETVCEDHDLYDGDIVYIGNACKGNTPFSVKIIRLGHADAIIELPCESGTTIKNLIATLPEEQRSKFYQADGKDVYEYRINGAASADGNSVIPTPTDAAIPVRLVMSTQTKGNE